jgi:hypothetical protein
VADKKTVGALATLARVGLVVALAFGVFSLYPKPTVANVPAPPCGQKVLTGPDGVVVRVLFAKNSSVQSYVIVAGQNNTEAVHDFLVVAEQHYGPQGVNAPPLQIVSFKAHKGGGGFQVPDKAVDSCGRTLSFT